MLNDSAFVPSSLYSSLAPSSGSEAETALPILIFSPTFSAIARVVVVPSANIGTSFTSVTLIVTLILSLPPLPSEAVIVTE